MAKIILEDYLDVGSGGPITAVSYQFALDKDFTKIIDSIDKSTEHLTYWESPLPKRPEDGDGYYSDLPVLYGRVKIWSGDHSSVWSAADNGSQLEQVVTIVDGNEITTTTAKDLGWYKDDANEK